MCRVGKKGKGDGDGTVGSHTEDFRKRVLELGYCSLPCLLGFTRGGHLDLECPNIADHGEKASHPARISLVCSIVREDDPAHATDCEPLLDWWIAWRDVQGHARLSRGERYTVICQSSCTFTISLT